MDQRDFDHWLRLATGAIRRYRHQVGLLDSLMGYPGVDDQAQEVLYKFWRLYLSRNLPEHRAKSYLAKVAKSRVIDDLRSYRRQVGTRSLSPQMAETIPDVTHAGRLTPHILLNALLPRLSEIEGLAMTYFVHTDSSLDDAHARAMVMLSLGISEGYMRKVIQRIRQKSAQISDFPDAPQQLPDPWSHLPTEQQRLIGTGLYAICKDFLEPLVIHSRCFSDFTDRDIVLQERLSDFLSDLPDAIKAVCDRPVLIAIQMRLFAFLMSMTLLISGARPLSSDCPLVAGLFPEPAWLAHRALLQVSAYYAWRTYSSAALIGDSAFIAQSRHFLQFLCQCLGPSNVLDQTIPETPLHQIVAFLACGGQRRENNQNEVPPRIEPC